MSEIIMPEGFELPCRHFHLTAREAGVKYWMGRWDEYKWQLKFKSGKLRIGVDIRNPESGRIYINEIRVNGFTWHLGRKDWYLKESEGLPSHGLPKEVAAVVNSALERIAPHLQQLCQAEAAEDQQERQQAAERAQRKLAARQSHFKNVLKQLG